MSESLTRTETRVSLPFGLGITVDRDRDDVRTDLVLGVVPWWVRADDGATCEAPCLSYDAERGVSFVAGIEIL